MILSPSLLQFPIRAVRSVRRFFMARLRSFRFWLLFCLAVIVLLIVYYAASDRYTPLTTDAYVQAYIVQGRASGRRTSAFGSTRS